MRAPLLALAALLALAPAADASVLKFDFNQKKVSYEGAAGELNQVTATQEGALVRIVDPGATITVQGLGCTSVSANEATCPIADPRHVVKLDGQDQDDQLTFVGTLSAQLEGADGNDLLTGSDGPDKLDGGAGADTLDGRAGADEVTCGPDLDAGPVDTADVLADDCEFKPAPPAAL